MELPEGQPPDGGEILGFTGSHVGPQIPLLMITLPGVLKLGQLGAMVALHIASTDPNRLPDPPPVIVN